MIRTVFGALALLLLMDNAGSPEPGRIRKGEQTLTGAVALGAGRVHSTMAVRREVALRDTSAVRNTPSVIAVSYQWLDGDTSGPALSGQPMRVRVSVVAARRAGPLRAEVYGHGGLIVSPMNWVVAELPANEPAERILTVTPYVAAPLRFSMLVQGEVDGQPQAAQITVPVSGEKFENR